MTAAQLSQCADRYGAEIYGFCKHLTGSTAEGEELYQDTFLKAMELSEQIDAANNPKSYLLSIAVRLWKNKKRKFAWRMRIAAMQSADAKEEHDQPLGDPNTLSPEETLLDRECKAAVARCVNALPPTYRLPICLYYSAELPIREIAAILKLPEGTVKRRLHQARKQIKQELEGMGYE